MLSNTPVSAAILILSVAVCWTPGASATDNALTESENQYLFDRLLYNLRSSENRQKSVDDLIRNYFPGDQTSTGNKNVLLQVLARLGNVPFNFGGPNEDPSSTVSLNQWPSAVNDDNRQPNIVHSQLVEDDMSKRWGSGPGPRGKRLAIDLRERRRDGPGPRGKRQGPRGKKQGPRGKKEQDGDEDYCLETIANTRYLCHCSATIDPAKCQVVGDK
uniref:Thyrotropin-releasing hormone 2 n=1 Tax=Ophionotus victoriae TaxID=667017 RepID=A0A220W0E1_9ECHI|nr:thyrotropin-releasing hormone 2 precursor [Ophionotus victoriae]